MEREIISLVEINDNNEFLSFTLRFLTGDSHNSILENNNEYVGKQQKLVEIK